MSSEIEGCSCPLKLLQRQVGALGPLYLLTAYCYIDLHHSDCVCGGGGEEGGVPTQIDMKAACQPVVPPLKIMQTALVVPTTCPHHFGDSFCSMVTIDNVGPV